LDVKNNWWGEDDSAEINAGTNPKALSFIYDGNTNGSAGKVNYAGWLNASGGTPVSDSMTGQLSLTDSSGNVAPTYQSGDLAYIQVADSDGNTTPSVADTLTVIITSETEDTGTPFSASEPLASSGNVGDGTLTILSTSYDTKTEDWSILAVSANSFLVTGSVSGKQSQQYRMDAENTAYVSDNNEVSFTIANGSVAFAAGDTIDFSTVAGTIVGETLTLTETAVDSGIFTGSVALNEASTPNAADGILEVQSGDLITVFYDDAQGDWGGAEQVRSTALYAATVVKGSTLLADTIWTEAKSPYLVTGDVTVSSGTTLTIMPGVKVLFLANSDDTVGGQAPYDSELIIQGNLNVAGTEAKGVTLTSSNREPVTGDWGGVRVENGTASFAYATLEYSAYGIDLYEVYSGKTFTLNNSELANNGTGIKASSSSNGVFTLTNNTIRDNSSYAVYSNQSYAHWSLDNNVISGNGQLLSFDWEHSVSLTNNEIINNLGYVRAYVIRGDFIVTGNTVTSNSSYGVYFSNYRSSGDWMTDSIVVEDNVIDDNGSYGIYIESSGSADPAINRNKVRNNSSIGIYIQTSENNTQPSIHDNEITGNGNVGLYVSGKAVPSIVGNTIDNNGSGIYVNYDDVNGNGDFALSGNVITNNQGYGVSVNGYAKPVINGNDIYGNTGYALENYTSFALNVKNNWWGEDDSAEINAGTNPKALSFIYDGNVISGAGKVNYAGWLSVSIQEQFASLISVLNDTNGDGKADILWRNSQDGRNWLWTMDGLGVVQSSGINTIADQAWQIVGRGDFDGDGKSDILWRNHDTGRNYIYLMDGFNIKQQGQLNYVNDSDWHVKGVADLDGDGKDDILWRHASRGDTWIYLMDGFSTKVSKAGLKVADLNWEIVASGDVNGDDKGDVIWRHLISGDNYIWLMDGTGITGRYVLNTVNTNWTIAGAGDLNGDGTDDIIWRNQSDGRNWAYLMSNGQIQTSSLINTVGNINWQIADISDLDGDGKADLFWRQGQSGDSYIYLMNGVSISSRGFSNKVNPQWQVIH
jgi:hypothetical protein